MDLQGKVIAITGAARGIGLSIATAVAEKGARVALLDINEAGLQEALATLPNSASHRTYNCNVADEKVVVETFAAIRRDFGSLHGMVNNAGVLRDGLLIKVKEGKVISKMSSEDYALVVDIHMKGAFLCTREAATIMVESGINDGCIISLSSVAADGNVGQTNYSAAKAGIIAQSTVWAKELGRYGIRSMVIAPGSIDTDLLRTMPKEILERFVASVPLRRIGQTHNIAQAAVQIFENDYLSGTVIKVHGGGFG